jgi:hypothetical protein
MFQWYYLALVSSILLGASTLIEKKTLKKEHAMAFTSSFAIIAAIISLAFLPFANFNISPLSVGLIYVVSVLVALTYWLTARVYKHGSISAASPAYAALPSLFVPILAFLFLGEKLGPTQYALIGTIIVATYLIMFTGKPQFESKKYIHWLILASLLTAVSTIGMKYLFEFLNITPYTYLILLEIFIAINMAIGMQLKYGGVKEIFKNTLLYKKEIASISLLITAYRITYYFSAFTAKISLVWPLSNVPNVIILVFLGGLIFNEGSIKRKAALAIVLLAAAYLIVV